MTDSISSQNCKTTHDPATSTQSVTSGGRILPTGQVANFEEKGDRSKSLLKKGVTGPKNVKLDDDLSHSMFKAALSLVQDIPNSEPVAVAIESRIVDEPDNLAGEESMPSSTNSALNERAFQTTSSDQTPQPQYLDSLKASPNSNSQIAADCESLQTHFDTRSAAQDSPSSNPLGGEKNHLADSPFSPDQDDFNFTSSLTQRPKSDVEVVITIPSPASYDTEVLVNRTPPPAIKNLAPKCEAAGSAGSEKTPVNDDPSSASSANEINKSSQKSTERFIASLPNTFVPVSDAQTSSDSSIPSVSSSDVAISDASAFSNNSSPQAVADTSPSDASVPSTNSSPKAVVDASPSDASAPSTNSSLKAIVDASPSDASVPSTNSSPKAIVDASSSDTPVLFNNSSPRAQSDTGLMGTSQTPSNDTLPLTSDPEASSAIAGELSSQTPSQRLQPAIYQEQSRDKAASPSNREVFAGKGQEVLSALRSQSSENGALSKEGQKKTSPTEIFDAQEPRDEEPSTTAGLASIGEFSAASPSILDEEPLSTSNQIPQGRDQRVKGSTDEGLENPLTSTVGDPSNRLTPQNALTNQKTKDDRRSLVKPEIDFGERTSSEKERLEKKSSDRIQPDQLQTALLTNPQQLPIDVVQPSNLQRATTAERVDAAEQIITQMVSAVSQIEQLGRTDTVVNLNHPPQFRGVQLIVSEFDSASSELNLTFANVKNPQVQRWLDDPNNLQKLRKGLSDVGFVVQRIDTTHEADARLADQNSGQDSRDQSSPQDDRRQGGQNRSGQNFAQSEES